ncbi:MAG: hypothetical protein JL50_12865 [Peptococcaceae bacterium BICA1-7]|jgi:acyl carrier protein|nr:MAG: hypothetical protein JL50_12865 [Peptococcaceae bacterium BICA1-7]HBV97291.1 acyl carrier protein [Desulfotomaculum sp.]
MNTHELINQIIHDTVKKYGIALETITEEKSIISELQADSLDIIELMLAFEENFNISINEKDIGSIVTVGDIYSFIENGLEKVQNQ